MKTTIYAILKNGRTGADVQRVELCSVILDENRLSADRYNRLKRQMLKTVKPAPKAHSWRLETAEGLRDTFGGYPALSFVRFAEVEA